MEREVTRDMSSQHSILQRPAVSAGQQATIYTTPYYGFLHLPCLGLNLLYGEYTEIHNMPQYLPFFSCLGCTTLHAGSQFSDQRLNLCSWQWKRGALNTGCQGMPPKCLPYTQNMA